MKYWLRKLGLILIIFLGLIVVFNFQFFWKNIKLIFIHPKVAIQTSAENKQPVKTTPNFISIPSLDIAAPIIYINQDTEAVFQPALAKGVVHFPGTAEPGQKGNCYIFGHSSDYFWSTGKYKTVFAVLPRIEKGAQIFVSNSQGQQFEYVVTDSFIAGAKDVKWLDQENYSKKLLTVQTSYPIGTALKRWIVRAEMK